MDDAQPKLYSFIDDPWGWLDISNTEIDSNDFDCLEKAVAAGMGSTSPVSSSQPTPRWRRLSCFKGSPSGRCSHSMTPIGNCCLILFGGGYIPNDDDDDGSRSSFRHLNDLWLFNGLTSQWKELQPTTTKTTTSAEQESQSFPVARRGHAMQYSQEHDALILFGGLTGGDEYLNDLWMLHLNTLCWERLGPPPAVSSNPSLHVVLEWPTARRGALSFIYKGRFYLFGGETTEVDELKIFALELTPKPQDWKWTTCTVPDRTVEGSPYHGVSQFFAAAPMPNMMHAPSIFDSTNAILYVYGGVINSGHINRFLHRFHLQENGISFHQVCVYAQQNQRRQRQQDRTPPNDDNGGGGGGGGGDDGDGDIDRDDQHYDYNFDGNSQPISRYFHGGCSLEGSPSENFVLVGGFGPHGNLSDSYLYNSKTKTWILLHDGPGPRNGLCLSPLLHGTTSSNVLLFGGGEYPYRYYDETYILELDKFCTTPQTGANNETNDDQEMCLSSPPNHMDGPFVTQQVDDRMDVELVISSSSSIGEEEAPPVFVELSSVQILSQHSEYFRRMFDGPFLEAQQQQSQQYMNKNQKRVIQLSDIKSRPASICLQYMHIFNKNNKSNRNSSIVQSRQQNDFLQKLREMDFDELDSIVVVADMWGMNRFLNILQDVMYLCLVVMNGNIGGHDSCNGNETTTTNNDMIHDELILFEYAKVHGFHKLAFKCLKRIKLKKRRSGDVDNDDWNDDGIINKWQHVGGDNHNNNIDKSLVQEVKSFLESSL